ncbi:fungal specific transcription factor [Colletotrichum incanum]|uniref:Fungal specific transcription factor n=1 Tax=Colletotrichum incanum TaxID=1573173 RepID=A0A166Q4C2_COLIC|nr:fungal specific transcription factor [Colletotrichum incanum]
MPDQSNHLNLLSCKRCKHRKVRCSRVMPTCDRCKLHDTECIYPQRVKRKVTRTLTDRLSPSLGGSSTTDGALSTILERLQRVEKHCTTISAPSQNPESPKGPLAPAPAPPAPLRHTSSSHSIPSNFSSPAPSSTTGGQETSPWTSFATPCVTTELDVAAILKDAVHQVQRLRLQTCSTAVITQHVEIPPELAKQWIKNYFTHMHTDMFLSLVNLKLIEMIPDLLEMPHVHLDPAILVVYYGVLYHGSVLGSTSMETDEGLKYIQMLYVCCLRSLPLWQREATGTTTDLIAALFMSYHQCRTAAECFDEELSWRMYTYACEYAQVLNLHNLDAHSTETDFNLDEAKLDADRKGFWELIQIDFFFRLLFNRPPAITNNMSTWKVNLPWLSGSAPIDLNAVPTVTFIMSSRLTFILSQFFQELEKPNSNEATVRVKTEEYCREISRLFAEYQLEDWTQRSFLTGSKAESWLLGDVAMTGYTYIIFMLRKLAVLSSNSPRPVSCDADVPDSPLAVDASRGILRVICVAIEQNSYPETMCVLLGIYRVYVSYACLLNNILRSSDVRAYAADIELLERVGDAMRKASRGERDFVPLLKAIKSFSMEVKRRMNDASTTDGLTMETGIGVSEEGY